MPEPLVRVRLDNGAEASIPAVFAESLDIKPLSRPSRDKYGRVVPVKYRVTKSGDTAASSKETTK